MTTLLIATSNPGKVKELVALLTGLNCRVIGLADLPEAPPPVEETGVTFAENALLKSNYYHALTGLPALADDSGLEVAALDGRPGVYSARYGGEGLTGAEQIELLLDEMKDVPDEMRNARFVCAVSLTGLTELPQLFEGQCEGLIARRPVGSGGFGYDPIFLDPQSDRTFAQLSPEEKATRSHRGQALQKACRFLSEML